MKVAFECTLTKTIGEAVITVDGREVGRAHMGFVDTGTAVGIMWKTTGEIHEHCKAAAKVEVLLLAATKCGGGQQ